MANTNENQSPPPARTFQAIAAPAGHRDCTTVGGIYACECGIVRPSREGLTVHHLNASVIAAVDGAPTSLLDSVRAERRAEAKPAMKRQAIPTLTLAQIDAEYAKAGGK